jgi:hypothetical protein
MSDPARVVVVRLCVEELWMSRRDGRFAALEDALVDVLNSEERSRPDKSARGAPGARVTKPRGDNVIVLTRALVTRMRRKA